MVSIKDAMSLAREALAQTSETPEIDAQMLLCAALDCSRSYLYTWPEKVLSASQQQAFDSWVQRRKDGEPVAYILQQRGFWTLDLHVAPGVLIPRTATETLIEVALERCESVQARVLDLGTGSGAIACALASERPQWQLLALDRSEEALAVAKQNAEKLALNNLELRQSDWFSAIESGVSYAMIVSNPPYIAPDDPHLQRGDLRFEPAEALAAAEDGLADLKAIIRQAPSYLQRDGLLVLEHGYNQAQSVAALLQAQGFIDIQLACDSDALPRISSAVWPGE